MMRYKILQVFNAALILLTFGCLAEEEETKTALDTRTRIPGQNDKCAAYCYSTYSPHTSEHPDSGKACQQGCRLYSILEFTNDNKAENVQGSCDSACKGAYDGKNLREACFAGCHHQSPFTTGKMEIVIDQKSPISKYAHSLFDGVFGSMEDMHKNMMKHFRSWWSDSDSSPLESINKEMDEMHQQMNRMMDGMMGMGRHHTMMESEQEKQHQQRGVQEKNGKPSFPIGSEFEGKKVGNVDKNGQEILNVRMFPEIRKGQDGETIIDLTPLFGHRRHGYDHHDRTGTMDSLKAYDPSPPVDPSRAVDPDASWLACLARRARRLSSITRWLVCLALFLCVLCMVWICLSIIRTAPKRRVLITKTEEVKVSEVPMSLEKKFLMESFGQPQDAPPPYMEEAEPLPVKASTA